MISFLFIWIFWIVPVIFLELMFGKNKSSQDIFTTGLLWPIYVIGILSTTITTGCEKIVEYLESKIITPVYIINFIDRLKRDI